MTMTIKEMRKIAKETGFKFDVKFICWNNGERLYNLVTDENAYTLITYNQLYRVLYSIFDESAERIIEPINL